MEQASNILLRANNICEKLNTYMHREIKVRIGVRNYLLGFKDVIFFPYNKSIIVLCKDNKDAYILNDKYNYYLTKIINETWKEKNIQIKFCCINENNGELKNADIYDNFEYFTNNIGELIKTNIIVEVKIENEVFFEKPKSEVIFFNEKIQKQTFDNFITAQENITAYEVCQSICCANDKELVQSGSVVFIYGETSTGKTHLLNSIKTFYQTAGGKVFYTTASQFLRLYVDSVQKKVGFSFQDNVLSNEIIMIDDVDELIGKNGTLQALKHIIMLAIENKRFIVLTSKQAPKILSEKNMIYKDILSNVMSLKIKEQQVETKAQIAINYIAEKNMNIPISIVKDLILRLDCNVRELKNYIKKLSIVQSIRKFELNSTLALEILKDDVNNDTYMQKHISNEKILSLVAEYYKLSTDNLCSKIKTTSVCRARNVAILLMRQINSCNFQEIARILNRTHASIIASLKNIEKWINDDKKLPAELADLRSMMNY